MGHGRIVNRWLSGRRVLKVAAAGVTTLAIAGVALYLFGLRVVLDGGGGFHLRFVESAQAQADAIARHRRAQQGDITLSASATAVGAPAAAPAATANAAPAAAPPAVLPGLWSDF